MITDLPVYEVSLPQPLTSLVGREADIAAVTGLLKRDGVRLVTLTGPGGVGKTRLAIEMASTVSDDFPGGVVFVPLASLNDPASVTPAIARALGIHGQGDASLLDQLSSLRDCRLLLVLDNFEHLLEAAPELALILGACSAMSMLVTSRTRLRISGEWDYAVGPLELPVDADRHAIDDPARAAALELFIQRAAAADSGFSLTAANLPAAVAICRRLDGLPLAIELAAARVRFLPPSAMLDQLDNSLPLLRGGGPDRPARHQTMSDAIRWSYEMLNPVEQLLFARLAVFTGGFSTDTAVAVCTAAGGMTPDEIRDGIEAQVEQSLIRPVRSEGSPSRFAMLEPIRDLARELLAASGELDLVRDAHARHFMSIIDRDMPPFDARLLEWVADVRRDEGNFMAALGWAILSGNAELAMRLALALVFLLWSPMVRYREQHSWISRVLELPAPGLDKQRANILGVLGWAELCLNDLDTASLTADKTFDLSTSSGNASEAAWALTIKALIAMERQDYAAAFHHLEPALKIARSETDLLLHTSVLNRLCAAATMTGEYDRATASLEESLAITRSVGDPIGLVDAYDTHAFLLQRRGDVRAAAALGREFLRASFELGSEQYLVFALQRTVRFAVALDRYEAAARLLGAAGRLEGQSGVPAFHMDPDEYQRDLKAVRDALTPEAFAAAWRAGATMPADHAVVGADHIIADWGESASESAGSPPSPFGLTARELEVLKLVAAGQSNREIAEALFISVPTVKVHVRSIMTKLDLDSRTAAAVFAIRNDLA